MGEREGWEQDRFDQNTLYTFMKFLNENNKNENPNFQRILVAAENAPRSVCCLARPGEDPWERRICHHCP